MLDCIALARPMPAASAENLAFNRPNMAVLEIILCFKLQILGVELIAKFATHGS